MYKVPKQEDFLSLLILNYAYTSADVRVSKNENVFIKLDGKGKVKQTFCSGVYWFSCCIRGKLKALEQSANTLNSLNSENLQVPVIFQIQDRMQSVALH